MLFNLKWNTFFKHLMLILMLFRITTLLWYRQKIFSLLRISITSNLKELCLSFMQVFSQLLKSSLYESTLTFQHKSSSISKIYQTLTLTDKRRNESHLVNVNDLTHKFISFRSGYKSCHERSLVTGEISWFSCISCYGPWNSRGSQLQTETR